MHVTIKGKEKERPNLMATDMIQYKVAVNLLFQSHQWKDCESTIKNWIEVTYFLKHWTLNHSFTQVKTC